MRALPLKTSLHQIGDETIIITGGINPNEKPLIDFLYIPDINNSKFELRTKFSNKTMRFVLKGLKAIKNIITLPKTYKYYVIQAGHTPILLLKALRLFKKKTILWINTGLPFELKFNKVNFILRHLLKYADGFISIGKMDYDLISEFFPKKPNFLIYPLITQKPKFRRIPQLNTHNILFFGGLSDKSGAYLQKRVAYKGADIMIGAFKLLKSQIPDLKLYIVGACNEATIRALGKAKDIYFLGRIDDIRDIIEKCGVSVNPGRGDAFPLTSLETMSLGLPTIVSEYTGTKEVVEKVDKRLICPINPNGLADALLRYFSLSAHKKRLISRKSMQVVKEFYKQYSITKAREEYLTFIKSLG